MTLGVKTIRVSLSLGRDVVSRARQTGNMSQSITEAARRAWGLGGGVCVLVNQELLRAACAHLGVQDPDTAIGMALAQCQNLQPK